MESGHYYVVVKRGNNYWELNDEEKFELSGPRLQTAFDNAYMIFLRRKRMAPDSDCETAWRTKKINIPEGMKVQDAVCKKNNTISRHCRQHPEESMTTKWIGPTTRWYSNKQQLMFSDSRAFDSKNLHIGRLPHWHGGDPSRLGRREATRETPATRTPQAASTPPTAGEGQSSSTCSSEATEHRKSACS